MNAQTSCSMGVPVIPTTFMAHFLDYSHMVKAGSKWHGQGKCHMKHMHDGHSNTKTDDFAKICISSFRCLELFRSVKFAAQPSYK